MSESKKSYFHLLSEENQRDGVLRINFIKNVLESRDKREQLRMTESKYVLTDDETMKMMQTYSSIMTKNPRLRDQLLGNPVFGYLIK